MISGFPSMDQHVDIAVCAHATCWSILRHYSERYNAYSEQSTHDVTRLAQQFDPGGLIPAQGLVLSQAERIFQEANTFPVIIARDVKDPDDTSFYRQLIAYVDSGFPVFAAMHEKGHAMAVVGYEWRTQRNSTVSGERFSWDEVSSFTVVDDNELP